MTITAVGADDDDGKKRQDIFDENREKHLRDMQDQDRLRKRNPRWISYNLTQGKYGRSRDEAQYMRLKNKNTFRNNP
jgi:hypothetical protein